MKQQRRNYNQLSLTLSSALLITLVLFCIQVIAKVLPENIKKNFLTGQINTKTLVEAKQQLNQALGETSQNESAKSVCFSYFCPLSEAEKILKELSAYRNKLQSLKPIHPEVKSLIDKIALAEIHILLIHANSSHLVKSFEQSSDPELRQAGIVAAIQAKKFAEAEDLSEALSEVKTTLLDWAKFWSNAKAKAEAEAEAWTNAEDSANAEAWTNAKAKAEAQPWPSTWPSTWTGARAIAELEVIVINKASNISKNKNEAKTKAINAAWNAYNTASALARAGRLEVALEALNKAETKAGAGAEARIFFEALAKTETKFDMPFSGLQSLDDAIHLAKSISIQESTLDDDKTIIVELAPSLTLIKNVTPILNYLVFSSLGITFLLAALTSYQVTSSINFQQSWKDKLSRGIPEEYLGELNALAARWRKDNFSEKDILVRVNLCLLNLYRIQLSCKLQNFLIGYWRSN